MIKIDVKAGAASKQRDDAVVLPLLDGRKLTESGKELQQATGNVLPDFLRKFDILGAFGKARTLYGVTALHTHRIMLIGAGEERELTLHGLRRLAATAARELDKGGARDVSFYLTGLNVRGAGLPDKVQAVAEGIWLGLYAFDKYQTEKEENSRKLRAVTIMVPSRRDLERVEGALASAHAISAGTNLARDLGNEPGNVCTPEFLGEQAATLEHSGLKVTVMNKAAIEQAGLFQRARHQRGNQPCPRPGQ